MTEHQKAIEYCKKLINAFKNEALLNKSAAQLLDINPRYLSMVTSKRYKKCPKHAWQKLLNWADSGLTIRKYGGPALRNVVAEGFVGIRVPSRRDKITELKKYKQSQIFSSTNLTQDKPPLGLRPRLIADEERIKEIQDAINRYMTAKKLIPDEWIKEYGELIGRDELKNQTK